MKNLVSDFYGEAAQNYQDAIAALDTFCDKEPQTLKQEPTYKPSPGASSRFHKVINVHYCPHRRALVFDVYRPANPSVGSKAQHVKGLAIPSFLLAELGIGIPGEWKWKNDVLNEGVDACDDLPDPFE